MTSRCNKCGQADPHGGDSWCLGCCALDALQIELKAGWGTAGTRALATDLLVSCVRQVRAVRRLGLAGAGRARALSPPVPERGHQRGDAVEPERSKGSEVSRAPTPPPPPPRPEAGAKTEPEEENQSEYDLESGEEESEFELDPDTSGLKAAPKSAAERPDVDTRPEIPRRRSEEEGDRSKWADRRRAPSVQHDKRPRSSRHKDRERRERSRSRPRRGEAAVPHPEKKRKRKNRGNHRAGKKHQRLYRAHQDPFKRFHHRQPDTFWDRAPTDL